LYQVNPDNAETQELISEPGEVLDFRPARDGMMILYSLLKESGDSAILALDRLTGESEPLITCSAGLCRNPQLSPDGSLLAFEFISREPGAQPGIQILDMMNKNREDLGDSDDYIDTPQWSPSGWLSYYNHSQQLYTFWNPQAGELLYLPNETGGDGSWTADGRYFVCSEILFTSETLAPRHLQLYDLSVGTLTDLSEGGLLEDLNPSFSPRGTDLAFSRKSLDPSTWSPGRQLWVMNLEDREAYPLTDEMDFNHTSFAWHPDGSQLAFVRYNQAKLTDPPEIWIINRDGSDKFRLIINGFAPAWIP
jgi:Tol biopolymer transport system component